MKNNMIYCFTGSGNSLYVAKEIAKATESKLQIIRKSLFDEELDQHYDRLGIVFPVYHQGLPVMVVEFLKKLDGVDIDYIYGVSTYGNKPTLALKYMKDILKGHKHKLSNGFAIEMPYNYLRPTKLGKGMYKSFTIKIPSKEKCNQEYKKAEDKLKDVSQSINRMSGGDVELSDQFIENLVDKLKLRDSMQKKQWLKIAGYKGELPDTFPQAIALMDTNFCVTNKCTSCGICAKICPAANITYEEDKPIWNHHCEQCMACLHWCSQGAIHWGVSAEETIQYQHPKVRLKDIINGGDEE